MAFTAAAALLLAGCAAQDTPRQESGPRGFSPSVYGVPASQRVVEQGRPVVRGGGVARVGRPYTVRGRTYVPREDPNYDNMGVASWYGDDFHGRRTANGEIYDMYAFSAAHRTLPMPSYVRVTNPANGRSLVVRINDRGPFHGNRSIDLSKRAAMFLDIRHQGVARVRVQYVGRAPLHGQDDDWLMAQARVDGRAVPPQRVAELAPIPTWANQRRDGRTIAIAAAVNPPILTGAPPIPLERPREQPVQVAALGTVPLPPREAPPPAPAPILAQREPVPQQAAGTPLALAPMMRSGIPAPQPIPAAVPPAPSPPPSQTAPRPAVGTLFVTLGSLNDHQRALRLREQMARHGGAIVEPVQVAGITFYQVRVGPFRDRAAAEEALRAAQGLGATTARIVGI